MVQDRPVRFVSTLLEPTRENDGACAVQREDMTWISKRYGKTELTSLHALPLFPHRTSSTAIKATMSTVRTQYIRFSIVWEARELLHS